MRLINTASGRFQDFFDAQRPRYAILSHTWGGEETSYLDFLFLTSDLPADAHAAVKALLRNPSKLSKGVQKIQACCKFARTRGFEWVWIDSCCIDKSSSAELSEAINSMWSWYRDAAECFVYLFDVAVTADQLVRASGEAWDTFSNARWFSRGWTLQELLAPKNVVFCNSRWEVLATKAQIGRRLSAITRIPLGFLTGVYDAADGKTCSVAMKMSWLSRRETTRTEDMAYCMLGLFDGKRALFFEKCVADCLQVHMPLIYGEGRKAFMRLQLEILKKSDDDSIYAWTAPLPSSGLLATWPTSFSNSGSVVQVDFPEDETPWLPCSMTSLGLEMRARYLRHDPHQHDIDNRYGVHTISTAVATAPHMSMIMHCGPHRPDGLPITQQWRSHDRGKALLITMERVGATWQRTNCNSLNFVDHAMMMPSQSNAYKVYYIAQQGL